MTRKPDKDSKPPAGPASGDALLWRRVAETIKPLARRKAAPVFALPVPPPAAADAPRRSRGPAPRPVGPPAVPVPPPELRAGSTPGVDRSTHDKLRRGQLALDAKLDLHGMDRERAHRALDRFLETSSAQGRRCLLIVTGKGGGKPGEPGVLKSEVPRWLNEQPNRARLIAFTSAQPRHGGAGALYVLLKRQRTVE
jgi:DNA-nicking Smr family endonuclease